MKTIKVFIVDDHKMIREGLRLFLENEPSIEITDDVGTVREMQNILENKHIDVLIIDFKLKDGDGINAALKAKERNPDLKTILITAYMESEIIQSALQSKIDAIVFKSIGEDDLSKTVIKVFEGNYNPLNNLPKQYNILNDTVDLSTNLSLKEQKILDWVSLGRTNAEIADVFDCAEKTIRNNIYNIYKKIHVSNRTEAAVYWIKNKITIRDK